ncbi:MAG: VWA domain-containing protein [Lentimicrobiaceae bacterium]|nr:VWA domain-containing protein [Lentimicrobiaceae bacterium]
MNYLTYLRNLEFADKGYLWILAVIPLLIVWYVLKHRDLHAVFSVSVGKPFFQTPSVRSKFRHIPFILRILALCFVVLALARPQSSLSHKKVNVEGIDIVMALDISGSMMAMDFRPNRLEACKNVIKSFIEGRPTDRIGLVVYAAESYTKCPLTTDHTTLLSALESVKYFYDIDGTAIGDGLGTAINRLRESKAKSKVIVLLTDGENNAGYIDPRSAAELAKEFNIRIYTIGCGTIGTAPINIGYGVQQMMVKIDEPLLKHIAKETGGLYFRAQNKNKLTAVYAEIDQMEKTRINETHFTNKSDEFFPFLVCAIALFLLEILLRYTVLRVKP